VFIEVDGVAATTSNPELLAPMLVCVTDAVVDDPLAFVTLINGVV
jgi:hypothetical protein